MDVATVVARYISGELSPEQRQVWYERLQADPELCAAFLAEFGLAADPCG